MRPRHSGSITRLANGRYRAQIPVDGVRRSLGCFATRDEAEAILAAAGQELRATVHRDGVTLRDWGLVALDRRETQGLRGVDQERSRWAAHILTTEIADLPVRSIVRSDVQRWLDQLVTRRARGVRRSAKPISRRTAGNALTLLRAVLEDALSHGVCSANAARDVQLPRARGRTHEPWTYLTIEEQERLLANCPEHARPMVAFAIATGLRQGEQWALELDDVHLEGDAPHVIVRYGFHSVPTKSGRPRRVDLLPAAVDAVAAQLDLLRRQVARGRQGGPGNPHRLLFPSVRGTRRARGAPQGWERWIEACAFGRDVRWHDLRHTCASSLVAGWWGRAWTLLEVRALLGHSTISITERYAHLAGTITESAVAQHSVRTIAGKTDGVEETPIAWKNARELARSHLRDLNSRPTVYETQVKSNNIIELRPGSAHACALRALRLVADGSEHALGACVDALGRLLEGPAKAVTQ